MYPLLAGALALFTIPGRRLQSEDREFAEGASPQPSPRGRGRKEGGAADTRVGSDREGATALKFHFSKHVPEELEKRKLSRSLLEQVLRGPEQKVPEVDDITCYQSRVEISEKTYLLRVMVNEPMNPAVVVTVYRTSKIGKYWRTP
jgi:hypothetical protein